MFTVGGLYGMGNASMPQVVSGASMRMPPSQKMANLFQQIDTSGSGTISKAQFEQAFQRLNPPPAIKAMGADAVFSKLDPNGAGSVLKQDFVNGMKSMVTHGHHQRDGANAVQGSASQGAAITQTLANSLNALNAVGNQAAPAPSPAATGAIGKHINTFA